MRIHTYLLFLAAFFLLLNAVPAIVFCQEEHPYKSQEERERKTPDSEKSTQAQGELLEPIRGLEIEGRLKTVDMQKKIFLILADVSHGYDQTQGERDENERMNRESARDFVEKELLFHYTDQTEIVGAENSIQGLAGDEGARVRIEYRAEGNKAIAERIELLGISEPGEKWHEKGNADEPSGGESEGADHPMGKL